MPGLFAPCQLAGVCTLPRARSRGPRRCEWACLWRVNNNHPTLRPRCRYQPRRIDKPDDSAGNLITRPVTGRSCNRTLSETDRDGWSVYMRTQQQTLRRTSWGLKENRSLFAGELRFPNRRARGDTAVPSTVGRRLGAAASGNCNQRCAIDYPQRWATPVGGGFARSRGSPFPSSPGGAGWLLRRLAAPLTRSHLRQRRAMKARETRRQTNTSPK